MPRSSIETTFSARALGNWEVPNNGIWQQRSGSGSSWGGSTRGGSVAGSRRSVGSRRSSRRSRGAPGSSASSSRMTSLVDANGHLLPGKKKVDSSFRYEVNQRHPIAKTSGMFVTWNDFDNQQDDYAERALALFGATGGGRDSVMSMERPRSVGSMQRTRPRSLRPLGGGAADRPRTPDAIFESGRRTPIVQMEQLERPASQGRNGKRGGAAQTLVLKHAPNHESDDVISARDTAVWVGGVPPELGEAELREMMERFGAVTAVSMRAKDDGSSWAFVIFAEAEAAAQVCSYMTIAEAGHAVQVARPDFARMTHADKKVFGQVWRETLKKTKFGRVLDSLRSQIEQSVPGGVRTMLKDFKQFRTKARSEDNLIDVKEFGAALRHCNLDMQKEEVAELFEDIDVDSSGFIDKDEFTLFVMGQHHALGAKHSAVNEGGQGNHFEQAQMELHGSGGAEKKQKEIWRTEAKKHQSAQVRDHTGGEETQVAAVDRSVWVGNIPAALAEEDVIKTAMESAFGEVDAVQLRKKGQDKLSWCFVIMKEASAAHKAVAAGSVKAGESQDVELKLEPVALKRELHAARQTANNPDGALGDVWRKTVQQTSHGKQLHLLRTKLQEKTQGGANSVLRLFKEFQRAAYSADHKITMDEFKTAVQRLNLPLSENEIEHLFLDLDMTQSGAITLDEFREAVLGKYGELGASTDS